MNKQILFVSHEASRTGAPIVLMNHLSGLKNNFPDFDFDVLLKAGGVLKDRFDSITNTYLIPQNTLFLKIKNKIIGEKIYFNGFLRHLFKNNYKAIYGNTVGTIDLLISAKKINNNLIVICHIHELDIAIKQYCGEQHFINAIPYIDYFVATSLTVKNNLISYYKIDAQKIHTHHGHIPLPKESVEYYDKVDNNCLRICGSGSIDWTKGVDLFIQVAHQLDKLNPGLNFEFCWIGGKLDSLDYEKVIYDIKKLDIEHRIKLIPSCPNPLDYLASCDIFFLPSREDSFPLICLEAASLGKPIMCFKKGGGMVEFVDEKNGWTIDYLDVSQVVNVLSNILKDNNFKLKLAELGAVSKLKSKEFDIDKGVKKWKTYLDSVLAWHSRRN